MADVLDTSAYVSSSSSSDSESSDEEKDNDEYRIECQEERELGISPRKRPRLSSPVSEQYKGYRLRSRKVIPTNPNKVGNDTANEDSAPTGDKALSKRGRSASGSEIAKRKFAVLMLNGEVLFCKIETVKYKDDTDKIIQHYISILLPEEIDGDIGLREGDLLIEVNGKQLLNRKQKRVIKIFKNIKPNKAKKIHMNLQFRRWEKRKNGSSEQEYVVDYKLKLVLEEELEADPTAVFKYRVSEEKLVETKETLLPKGNIVNIKKIKETLVKIKCMPCGPQEYLAAVNGKLVVRVSKKNEENETFTLQIYKGEDKSPEPPSYYITFVRIQSMEKMPLANFVCSNTKKVYLRTSVPTVKHIDETCFKRRKYGSEVVLESFLYKGYCIGSQTEDKINYSLKMVKKSDYDLDYDINLGDVKFGIFKPQADTRHDPTDDADSYDVE